MLYNNTMKTKPKKKPIPSLAKLRKLADRIWSLKVKSAYGHKCAVCGATDDLLNSHHIEPRTASAYLRWDPLDGISLCVTHHKYGRDAAHKSTIFFYEFLYSTRIGVLKHVKGRRRLELKADEVKRPQMEEFIQALWSDFAQYDADALGMPLGEINSRWAEARSAMRLTAWERTLLEDLSRRPASIEPVEEDLRQTQTLPS